MSALFLYVSSAVYATLILSCHLFRPKKRIDCVPQGLRRSRDKFITYFNGKEFVFVPRQRIEVFNEV